VRRGAVTGIGSPGAAGSIPGAKYYHPLVARGQVIDEVLPARRSAAPATAAAAATTTPTAGHGHRSWSLDHAAVGKDLLLRAAWSWSLGGAAAAAARRSHQRAAAEHENPEESTQIHTPS